MKWVDLSKSTKNLAYFSILFCIPFLLLGLIFHSYFYKFVQKTKDPDSKQGTKKSAVRRVSIEKTGNHIESDMNDLNRSFDSLQCHGDDSSNGSSESCIGNPELKKTARGDKSKQILDANKADDLLSTETEKDELSYAKENTTLALTTPHCRKNSMSTLDSSGNKMNLTPRKCDKALLSEKNLQFSKYSEKAASSQSSKTDTWAQTSPQQSICGKPKMPFRSEEMDGQNPSTSFRADTKFQEFPLRPISGKPKMPFCSEEMDDQNPSTSFHTDSEFQEFPLRPIGGKPKMPFRSEEMEDKNPSTSFHTDSEFQEFSRGIQTGRISDELSSSDSEYENYSRCSLDSCEQRESNHETRLNSSKSPEPTSNFYSDTFKPLFEQNKSKIEQAFSIIYRCGKNITKAISRQNFSRSKSLEKSRALIFVESLLKKQNILQFSERNENPETSKIEIARQNTTFSSSKDSQPIFTRDMKNHCNRTEQNTAKTDSLNVRHIIGCSENTRDDCHLTEHKEKKSDSLNVRHIIGCSGNTRDNRHLTEQKKEKSDSSNVDHVLCNPLYIGDSGNSQSVPIFRHQKFYQGCEMPHDQCGDSDSSDSSSIHTYPVIKSGFHDLIPKKPQLSTNFKKRCSKNECTERDSTSFIRKNTSNFKSQKKTQNQSSIDKVSSSCFRGLTKQQEILQNTSDSESDEVVIFSQNYEENRYQKLPESILKNLQKYECISTTGVQKEKEDLSTHPEKGSHKRLEQEIGIIITPQYDCVQKPVSGFDKDYYDHTSELKKIQQNDQFNTNKRNSSIDQKIQETPYPKNFRPEKAVWHKQDETITSSITQNIIKNPLVNVDCKKTRSQGTMLHVHKNELLAAIAEEPEELRIVEALGEFQRGISNMTRRSLRSSIQGCRSRNSQRG